MHRALPAVVAVLVVGLSVPAGSVGGSWAQVAGPAPPAGSAGQVTGPAGQVVGPAVPAGASVQEGPENPVTRTNTTAKLSLPPGAASGTAAAGADLGSALALAQADAADRIDEAGFLRQFEAAGTDEERAAILRRDFNRTVRRTGDLHATERRLARRYARGNLTARELLLGLASIDREARLLRDRLDRLRRFAVTTRSVSFSQEEFGVLDNRLEMLTTPLRRHVRERLTASAPSTAAYVATAEEGVVVAAVVNGTYVREAVRFDYRARGAGHPLVVLAFVNRTYPWVWEHRGGGIRSFNFPTIGLWQMTVPHAQGRLRAYVDTGNERVFREVQWLDPARLPATEVANTSADGLRVTVNRTFPGGPLSVAVTSNRTGRPVGAVVSLGGQLLGRTGPDGFLWTVAPRGTFEVTVEQGANLVNATVPASDPLAT